MNTGNRINQAITYFFRIKILMSAQIIPAKNIIMAMALMVCITLRLKLVGLFGSFFLKKYINKYREIRRKIQEARFKRQESGETRIKKDVETRCFAS